MMNEASFFRLTPRSGANPGRVTSNSGTTSASLLRANVVAPQPAKLSTLPLFYHPMHVERPGLREFILQYPSVKSVAREDGQENDDLEVSEILSSHRALSQPRPTRKPVREKFLTRFEAEMKEYLSSADMIRRRKAPRKRGRPPKLAQTPTTCVVPEPLPQCGQLYAPPRRDEVGIRGGQQLLDFTGAASASHPGSGAQSTNHIIASVYGPSMVGNTTEKRMKFTAPEDVLMACALGEDFAV